MCRLLSKSSALHVRFPCLANAPAILIVKAMAQVEDCQSSGFATMLYLLEEGNNLLLLLLVVELH